ncbi:hypothetical protein SMM_0347 [Spiroplasma mirum ATCC 29335]|nr:hypothetical protein SMM_0347 [Spiroplasma mirum ATCC 29335]
MDNSSMARSFKESVKANGFITPIYFFNSRQD